MNRQIFLGIFLIIIGAIGFIVGAVTHHLTDSTPALKNTASGNPEAVFSFFVFTATKCSMRS